MRYTREQLEGIVFDEVKPINRKATMISFIAIAAEQGVFEAEPLGEAEDVIAHRIALWIEQTWPNHTVRAKMAQKIARMIRSGDWKPEPQQDVAPT